MFGAVGQISSRQTVFAVLVMIVFATSARVELRFLPPYSPDCNPIEMAFAKVKAFLEKYAPRTVDDFWDAIAQAIDTFTPTECQNYFSAAGYDLA